MGNKEKQLLQLFRTDSRQAVCQLIDLYGGAVTAICRHILRACDGSLIEDAVQDTFVRLWKNLSVGNVPQVNLKAYTYKTARNCAISVLREYKTENNVSLEQLQYTGIEEIACIAGNVTEDTADKESTFETVHKAIEEMTEPDRSIFVLKYFYNYTAKEISIQLNLNEDNVESRLRRNLKNLRNNLKKRGVSYD
jgi:RNA polymerase sigma-70 factor (ECF subfamily)